MGLKVGVDNLAKYSHRFGFGEKTGIELDFEKQGLVPSRSWKKRRFKNKKDRRWYPGETINFAIGQTYLLVTPLQVSNAMSLQSGRHICW